MNNNLSAIELLDLARKNDYVNGKVSGYDRVMACVQGSEAHSLANIGSRQTFVKMDHLSSEGIRLRFLAFDKDKISMKWFIKIIHHRKTCGYERIFRGEKCF